MAGKPSTNKSKVPKGRKKSIQHLWLVIIPMFLQKILKLFTKTFFPMMFFLRLYVMNGVINSRYANAKCAETFLPRKTLRAQFGKCLAQPFCRVAFQQLHRFGNGKRRGQTHKQ